jgi:hypothetical protein
MLCSNVRGYFKWYGVLLAVLAGTCFTNQLITADSSDDVKITVLKQTIIPGEVFSCDIESTIPIKYNTYSTPSDQLRVVSSIELGSIATATNYIDLLYYVESTIFNLTKLRIPLLYQKLVAPVIPCCDIPKTNVTVMDWTTIPPLHVVVVNEKGDKILGTSKAFRIAHENIDIILYERSYFPGEGMNWTFSSSLDVGDTRIFAVPYSLKNNQLRFNDATVVKQFYNPPYDNGMRRHVVEWSKPGLYQAVAFSEYGQIIRGISNTFKVKAETSKSKTKISVDSSSYVTGQSITTTITREDGTPYQTQLRIDLVPASATSDADFAWDNRRYVGYLSWDTKSKTITNTGKIPWCNNGWYKVLVIVDGYDSEYRLGVSSAIQVEIPIKVDLSKHTYLQGEKGSVDIDNPIDLEQYVPETDGSASVDIEIVPTGFVPQRKNDGSYDPFVYRLQEDFVATMVPGEYQFVVNFHLNEEIRGSYEIADSTFKVLENNPIVKTDKKSYKKGDTIILTLTTRRNKVFPESYPVYIVSESDNNIQYKMASFETDTVVNQLTTTILVDWLEVGKVLAVVESPWYVSRWGMSWIWGKSETFTITK